MKNKRVRIVDVHPEDHYFKRSDEVVGCTGEASSIDENGEDGYVSCTFQWDNTPICVGGNTACLYMVALEEVAYGE
jgi:hypothetical protein